MNKGRDIGFDMVKLITIFLVIVGHIIPFIGINWYDYFGVEKFIYSFHMPLFIIISGYFCARSITSSFGEMVRKKTKQLILPALTCTFIICLWELVIGFPQQFSFRDEIIGNSWFLKTLFILYLLGWLMKHIPIKEEIFAIISIIILFCIPHAYSLQINYQYPYFLMGYFLNKNKYACIIKPSGFYKLILPTVYIILFYISYNFYDEKKGVPITISNLINYPYNIFIRYLVAISGSFFVITTTGIICNIYKNTDKLKKIAEYGKYTLGIYVVQTFFITLFERYNTITINYGFAFYSIALILSLLLLFLCILIIKKFSKNKILDLIFFGGAYNQYNNKKLQ